jgi:hypothetical protein
VEREQGEAIEHDRSVCSTTSELTLPRELSLSPQRQTTTTVPLTKGLLTHEDSTGLSLQSTLQLC